MEANKKTPRTGADQRPTRSLNPTQTAPWTGAVGSATPTSRSVLDPSWGAACTATTPSCAGDCVKLLL
eukprot:2466134-Amphidinium_carterae.1